MPAGGRRADEVDQGAGEMSRQGSGADRDPREPDPSYPPTEMRQAYSADDGDRHGYRAYDADETVAGGYAAGPTAYTSQPPVAGYPGHQGSPPTGPHGTGSYPPGAYRSGGYPAPYPQRSSGGRPVWIAVMVASIVVIVACLGVGAYLVFGGPSGTSAAPSVSTVTATGGPATDTGSASPTTRSPGTPPAGEVDTYCDSTAGSGTLQKSAVNSVTSCPFAENVRAAYNAMGHPGTLSQVFSPTTGTPYDMVCDYADRTTTLIECTGGDNAVVWLY
ncbi:hypothetical protein [Tsukamurella sp. 8J]|nr:hypothetical protein [Tsukamurella sp. 8J]MDF0530812.1 hypothetical protein [Tsukamurella sp. 8J]